MNCATVTSIQNIPGVSSADRAGTRSDHILLAHCIGLGRGERGPGPSESHMTRMVWADPSPLISTKFGAAWMPRCRTKLHEVSFSDAGVDLSYFPCSFAAFMCGYDRDVEKEKEFWPRSYRQDPPLDTCDCSGTLVAIRFIQGNHHKTADADGFGRY